MWLTMQSFDDTLNKIAGVHAFDYFKNRAMPAFLEPTLTTLITDVISMPDIERAALLARWHTDCSGPLGWYARKLAGRSVRNGSVQELERACVAIALASRTGDFRDELGVAALLYESAKRLAESPDALFERVSRLMDARGASLLRGFLRRAPHLRSIESFGFSAGRGPEGFDYLPLLAEYGGPTPLD